jgi:hypothetical protein
MVVTLLFLSKLGIACHKDQRKCIPICSMSLSSKVIQICIYIKCTNLLSYSRKLNKEQNKDLKKIANLQYKYIQTI